MHTFRQNSQETELYSESKFRVSDRCAGGVESWHQGASPTATAERAESAGTNHRGCFETSGACRSHDVSVLRYVTSGLMQLFLISTLERHIPELKILTCLF